LLLQQFTYVGAPSIWNGDEMGMWGSDDPDCRKPLIWPEYKFEPEETHPYDYYPINDEVAFDSSLFTYYKSLIDLRNQNKVLRAGEIRFNKTAAEKGLFAYSRKLNNEQISVFFNNTEGAISHKPASTVETVFSLHGARNAKGEIILPPHSAIVLKE